MDLSDKHLVILRYPTWDKERLPLKNRVYGIPATFADFTLREIQRILGEVNQNPYKTDHVIILMQHGKRMLYEIFVVDRNDDRLWPRRATKDPEYEKWVIQRKYEKTRRKKVPYTGKLIPRDDVNAIHYRPIPPSETSSNPPDTSIKSKDVPPEAAE